MVRRRGSERAKGVKKESVRNIPGRKERREKREKRKKREKRRKKKEEEKERKKKSKSKKGSCSVTVPTRHLAVISVSHATCGIEKEGCRVEFQSVIYHQKCCHLDTFCRQMTSFLGGNRGFQRNLSIDKKKKDK